MKKRVVAWVLVFMIIGMPIGFSSSELFSNVKVPRVDVSDTLESSEDGLTRYVYGEGLVASVKSGNVKYHHSDRLQSNRLVTDSSGSVENEFKSLPFGQEISNSGVKYAFATNKELDESELYYFGARYYDSDLGRFTSVDPIANNGAYNYVNNNPEKFVDPDGESAILIGVGIATLLSGTRIWDHHRNKKSNVKKVVDGVKSAAVVVKDAAVVSAEYTWDSINNLWDSENRYEEDSTSVSALYGGDGSLGVMATFEPEGSLLGVEVRGVMNSATEELTGTGQGSDGPVNSYKVGQSSAELSVGVQREFINEDLPGDCELTVCAVGGVKVKSETIPFETREGYIDSDARGDSGTDFNVYVGVEAEVEKQISDRISLNVGARHTASPGEDPTSEFKVGVTVSPQVGSSWYKPWTW